MTTLRQLTKDELIDFRRVRLLGLEESPTDSVRSAPKKKKIPGKSWRGCATTAKELVDGFLFRVGGGDQGLNKISLELEPRLFSLDGKRMGPPRLNALDLACIAGRNEPMTTRLFDHLDLRVRDLREAEPFYAVILPALGFPTRGEAPHCVYFEAIRQHPKPEFIALIEDRAHVSHGTRIAFCRDTPEQVDAFAALLPKCGAKNIEGPEFCPEYTPTYYAVYFEDPCGNRFEVCCRTASPKPA